MIDNMYICDSDHDVSVIIIIIIIQRYLSIMFLCPLTFEIKLVGCTSGRASSTSWVKKRHPGIRAEFTVPVARVRVGARVHHLEFTISSSPSPESELDSSQVQPPKRPNINRQWHMWSEITMNHNRRRIHSQHNGTSDRRPLWIASVNEGFFPDWIKFTRFKWF